MKRNILKSFLLIGLGLISITIVFAASFDLPNIRLNGFDISRSSTDRVERVILNCEVTDDGGSFVTEYIGEIRYDGGPWIIKGSCNHKGVAHRKCDYVFHTFHEGEKARFRVRSVNRAGAGEPVELEHWVEL